MKHHHVIVHILTVQMSSWCLRDDIGPTLLLKKEEGLTAAAKKGEFDVDYYLSIHFWQQWGMKIGSLLSLEWSFHYLPQLYLICDDGHFEKRTRKAGPKRQLEELDVFHYRSYGNWKSTAAILILLVSSARVLYFSFDAQGSRGECIYGLFDWSFRASSGSWSHCILLEVGAVYHGWGSWTHRSITGFASAPYLF